MDTAPVSSNRGGDSFPSPSEKKDVFQNRAQRRADRRAMRVPCKAPQGLQARWKFLKGIGHPAANQYGMVAKAFREYNKKQKELAATPATNEPVSKGA